MKRSALVCAILPFACAFAGAQECKLASPVPQAGQQLAWSGACKDGHAEGPGVLTWHRPGKPELKYEVTLVRGEISGEGSMSSEKGNVYTGTFRNAVPNGSGYWRYADGRQYEGEVRDGLPDGAGVMLSTDGTRYEGQWKAGKKDGAGRIAYAIGGAYEGQSKDDKFNGKGTITYAGSGRQVEGEFRHGQLEGAPDRAPPQDARYTVKDEIHIGSMLPRTAAIAPVPAS